MLKRILVLAVVLSGGATIIIEGAGIAAGGGGDLAATAGPGGILVVAQDGTGDHTLIQDAIDDFSASEIVVMPGKYEENILITKNLKIRAFDGPLTTIIDGSKRRRWTKGIGGPSVVQDNVIDINKALNVVIEGLCVTNGVNGVYVQEDDNVTLRDCAFWANQSMGIVIHNSWSAGHGPRTTVYNCVCVSNGAHGMGIGQWHQAYLDHCPVTTIRNSIFVANGTYGITFYESDSLTDVANVSLDYNCCTGNKTANYGPGIGQGQSIPAGVNSFADAPYFVDGNGGDFRLATWSRCINAGAPGAAFTDPDGTLNDVGAYGGPGAATFFQNPWDGPMVRELTVTPGSVSQGTPLTIRAVGSVR